MTLQPIFEFGGAQDAPLIHVAVANGFPPQTYLPLVQSLTERYRVVSLPPRALWPEAQDPAQLRSWREVADDLLRGLRHYDLKEVIAIGHSFGGIASLLAAIEEPSRFRGLCLLDPTVMSPKASEQIAIVQQNGQMDAMPLVQGALRRRRQFASVEAAHEYFKSKPLFSTWPAETVRLYAESMMQAAADGEGMELTWSPEWEAQYYRHVFPYSWEVLPRTPDDLLILTLRGTNSDTLSSESVARMQAILPQMRYGEISGGHLFPQTAPAATREAIMRWLDQLGD